MIATIYRREKKTDKEMPVDHLDYYCSNLSIQVTTTFNTAHASDCDARVCVCLYRRRQDEKAQLHCAI